MNWFILLDNLTGLLPAVSTLTGETSANLLNEAKCGGAGSSRGLESHGFNLSRHKRDLPLSSPQLLADTETHKRVSPRFKSFVSPHNFLLHFVIDIRVLSFSLEEALKQCGNLFDFEIGAFFQ